MAVPIPIDRARMDAPLVFLREIDRLKSVYRPAYLADTSRHESDAEHVWHACLFAILLHGELNVDADLAHSLELLLIHDLVEAYAGDTPLHDEAARAAQPAREAEAARRLFVLLPDEHASKLRSWWIEHEK